MSWRSRGHRAAAFRECISTCKSSPPHYTSTTSCPAQGLVERVAGRRQTIALAKSLVRGKSSVRSVHLVCAAPTIPIWALQSTMAARVCPDMRAGPSAGCNSSGGRRTSSRAAARTANDLQVARRTTAPPQKKPRLRPTPSEHEAAVAAIARMEELGILLASSQVAGGGRMSRRWRARWRFEQARSLRASALRSASLANGPR